MALKAMSLTSAMNFRSLTMARSAAAAASSVDDPGCPVITNSLATTEAGSGPQGGGGAWQAFDALAEEGGCVGGGGERTFFTGLERGETPDMMQAAKRDGQAAPTKDGSGLCLESCCKGDISLFVSRPIYEQTCLHNLLLTTYQGQIFVAIVPES
jgi:hypothetical protein